jgi:MtN3 and saliva related transmembrane protein
MMISLETWTGIAASAFTAIALLPQLIKLIKTRKAGELSLGMFLLLFTGLSLWILYGIQKKDPLIIISNSFSVLVNILTTVLSLRYKRR